MSDQEDDQKSSLKTCLEESNNPRMQNYVKILDTPNISAFEWIHRTQEELMDGIVYLEKLKDTLSANMRELDAARVVSAPLSANEEQAEESENININLNTTDTHVSPKKRKPKLKVKEQAQEKQVEKQVEKKEAGQPKRKVKSKKTHEQKIESVQL
jgi:hypothetical protein